MQVSVETGEGTERTLKIQVPAETLNQEVENRIKSMRGNVKIDGFRPGKVPVSVIKKRYGAQVFQEVAGEMLQSTFQDALTQENLKPAGAPVFDAQTMELGEPLEYTATFDVVEEITLAPIADIKLERLAADVSAADVENMIETLRNQRVIWSEVDRASEDGDRVSVSFKGTIDGEAFDGGSSENTPVIIGSASMIPGFEDQLKGLSKADTTTIKTPFPDDYKTQELAGKEAEFAIEVKLVEAPTLPEINEEFAKAFGVEDGSVDNLKSEIKGNMERELQNRIRADLKTKVMEQLLEKNPISAPKSVVQEEAKTLQKQTSEMTQGQEAPLETFTEEATKRVKLGLILGEVAKLATITPSQEMVKERIESMAKDYSEPEEFVNHYYGNQELLKSVENLVVEELIVDWIVDSATVTDVKTTFDELMK